MELLKTNKKAPLAWRMQPENLDEFAGQEHIFGKGIGYKYPHNYKGHHVDQQYMINNKLFFFPSDQGYEKIFKKRLSKRRSR
jgi:putative ATPase